MAKITDIFGGARSHLPAQPAPTPVPAPAPAPRAPFIMSDEKAFSEEDLSELFAAGKSVPLPDEAKPNLNASVGKTLEWMRGVGLNPKGVGLADFAFGFFVVRGDDHDSVGVHPHLYVVFKTPNKKLVEPHSMEAIEAHGAFPTAVSLMHLYDKDNEKAE